MKSPSLRSAFTPAAFWRVGGVAVIASMTIPLAGCGTSQPPPPVDAAPGQMAPQTVPQAQTNQGMSTGTKLKLLAGAAAAYYAYNKWKQSQAGRAAEAQNVQYYVSKSTGRVYYRDPKTKQAIWVTPPPNQIQQVQIPASEAAAYERFKGYENRNTGQGLNDVFSVQ